MRKLLALLLVGGLCTLGLGCGKNETKKSTEVKGEKSGAKNGDETGAKTGDETGDKTGAKTGDETGDKTAKEGSVTLTPEKPVTVAKGKTADAMITVKRTHFEGPLMLKFDVPPKSGLKVMAEPAEGDEAKATIDATKANKGTYDVKIQGTSEKGLKEPAEGTLKVTVK